MKRTCGNCSNWRQSARDPIHGSCAAILCIVTRGSDVRGFCEEWTLATESDTPSVRMSKDRRFQASIEREFRAGTL
jgi:hypothetical protein